MGMTNAISNGGNFSTLVGVNQAIVGKKHLNASSRPSACSAWG